MPFVALRIYQCSETQALEDATRGWMLFLSVGNKKSQYSCLPLLDPKAGQQERNANPVWEEFFANDEGRLNDTLTLRVAQIAQGEHEGALPTFVEKSATVVAQLRTEYAVNLSLRLAAHLSRVGLDFQSVVRERAALLQ